jgi:hypothetical protein
MFQTRFLVVPDDRKTPMLADCRVDFSKTLALDRQCKTLAPDRLT